MSWTFVASTGEQIPIKMDKDGYYCGVVKGKIEYIMALDNNEQELLRLGKLIGRMEKTKDDG